MSIIGSNILAGASGQAIGYNINNSLRFRASASASLSRTFTTPTNNRKWTMSFWIKRGALGVTFQIFAKGNTSTQPWTLFYFDTSDKLNIYEYSTSGTSPNFNLTTNAVFRDPSAWYHIVVSVDTTLATAADRQKLYVNGTQQTFSSSSYYPQNTDTQWNSSGGTSYIGRHGGGQYIDGYMTEINFLDGYAYDPTYFGETSTTTGSWIPKEYSGSYGTNGFYLQFSDIATTSGSNAGLGKDFSGNGNYWTTNNISVTSGVTYDAMLDSPTNTSATVANYCTLNPLVNLGGNGTMSFGNMRVTTASSGSAFVFGTIGVSTGKWYWEGVLTTDGSNVGISVGFSTIDNATYIGYYSGNGYTYTQSGSAVYGASWVIGDVIGVAADFDSNTITFYKNNTSQGASTSAFTTGLTYFPTLWDGSGSPTTVADVNFGQRPFAYTAPAGYVALNTFNLPNSTIKKGNSYMDATLYTGTGASLSVTNAGGFYPDWVWVKGRSGTTDHALYDSVRGTTKQIEANTAAAETTESTGLTAFNSNGFTVGALAQMNTSAATYVGWQWQAGQGTTSSGTGTGGITSVVQSVNTTAGFSIVTYTGSGANGTVTHGLGVAPSWVIVKRRDTTGNWQVRHTSIAVASSIQLNSDAAAASATTVWNSTAPSSTVFSVGTDATVNASAATYVAYCWAAISGFSAFGSYTGNGSADGPFVFTNFRPKFVLVKGSTYTSNWNTFDTSRNTYNITTQILRSNLADAEFDGNATTGGAIDITSNGFKIRKSDGDVNSSGQTLIYMAFAEHPFKNANAR